MTSFRVIDFFVDVKSVDYNFCKFLRDFFCGCCKEESKNKIGIDKALFDINKKIGMRPYLFEKQWNK